MFLCGFVCGAFLGFYWVQWIRSIYERQYDAFTGIHEEEDGRMTGGELRYGKGWRKDGGP